MMILWGRANSSNVKKVLWCLEALQLPYERRDVGGEFGQLETPEYLALNPNSLIPTLKDNDFVLWESNSIMRYLAEKYGQGALLPSVVEERARMNQWLDWSISSLFEPMRTLIVNLVRTPKAQQSAEVIETFSARCHHLLRMADQQLAQHPFLAGSLFTLADISLVCYAYIWFNLPMHRESMPHLERWYEQISEMPLFQKIVALPLR